MNTTFKISREYKFHDWAAGEGGRWEDGSGKDMIDIWGIQSLIWCYQLIASQAEGSS